MAYLQEIERKFLIKPDQFPDLTEPYHLVQGYLSFEPTVRIRVEKGPEGDKGFITIKGTGEVGRDEFEYFIPIEEAEMLLNLAKGALVSKRRYKIPLSGNSSLKWEIDFFEGLNEGLVVAELEMPDYDYNFEKPAWLGEDVTEDVRYKNSALAQHPFKFW